MGIWDELQSSVSRLISRKNPSKHPLEADAFGAKPATAFVSNVAKADAVKLNGGQKLDEYFPDPHRREKIGKILSNLGKFAVDSAVNESLKGVTEFPVMQENYYKSEWGPYCESSKQDICLRVQ